MMRMLKSIFTWWNGQTIGTSLFTKRKGSLVGEDEQGNKYYESKSGRRWVVYNGIVEASRVSSDWHGWLHHTWNDPPNVTPLKRKSWEKAHQENLTGTQSAYAPAGSLRLQSPKPAQDYEAWQPEG